MKLDFFDCRCQEQPIADKEFGICDDENGEKAYIDKTDAKKWIAAVKNEKSVVLTFTAIDKCVLNDSDFAGRGRCDGMLTSQDHLFLIELKNQKKNWQQGAFDQLLSTIEFLIEFHDQELKKFRHKKAFACNKKSPGFGIITQEVQRRFFNKYGFRLDLQANVVIV